MVNPFFGLNLRDNPGITRVRKLLLLAGRDNRRITHGVSGPGRGGSTSSWSMVGECRKRLK